MCRDCLVENLVLFPVVKDSLFRNGKILYRYMV